MAIKPFRPNYGTGVSLAVDDTASAAVELGLGDQLYLRNAGSDSCFVKVATSAVVSDEDDFPLIAGEQRIITIDNIDGTRYISAICASGETTTLLYIVGDGGI